MEKNIKSEGTEEIVIVNTENINENTLQDAEEKYEEAVKYYDIVAKIPYEDSETKLIEAEYSYGCQALSLKSYYIAIVQFTRCDGYKDSAKKILEAKYGYVNNNLDASNTTIYQFLKELVDANYADSRSIYNNLYAWNMTITSINVN